MNFLFLFKLKHSFIRWIHGCLIHSDYTRFVLLSLVASVGEEVKFSSVLLASVRFEVLNEMEEFKDARTIEKTVTKIVSDIPHSEYIKTFKKYKERLKLCINAEGDYFEHLYK